MKERTRRAILLFVVIAVFAVGGIAAYLLSPRRDLEVALGVKRLPASLRRIDVKTDAWTDYVVQAYFEIDPDDFEKILAVRSYERVQTRVLGVDLASVKEYTSVLPATKDMEVAYSYHWSTGKQTWCHIFADMDRKRVVVTYATH